ncbi:hypothetical protein L6164_012131 [Bauhinia variegata]|uniref:Uncharacterized protein n=1 Tax=Bauhinia variegata TaxID=167791 RepID=A0ACB9P942_BAUVA|nr:hypothetical protein L6164_012131 [Bauhinia variegata]
MATLSHAQAVKSLNKSHGRRRFVFKTFSQRLEDIDINVYRSLEKIKSEPSDGSSFFRDCLIEWRELNTAEDFIAIYEETLPYTQTLPLVLLHKESLISKLLSRLHIKARLSLEPILRLLAALSRDLLEEYVPLLPRIVDSLVSLLESGADREPEIIEQIFTSWSYIMMYLQKYLLHNPLNVLRVTTKLRYYPKDYVQEFMAESMSFVLRNAPDEQLKRGIGRVMLEAVKKPSQCRKSGVEALLYHIMRGSSMRFHSKAERVLQLLTSDSVFCIGDKESSTILEVVKSVFKRLCEKMEPEELNLVWKCLYKEVSKCVSTGNILHLGRLLSVLASAVKLYNGQKVSDYKPMLEVVSLVLQTHFMSSGSIEPQDDMSLVVDKILKFMLGILNGVSNFNDKSTISECAIQWAPIFKLRSPSLLGFIRELLQKEHCVLAFRSSVISAINDLMKNSEGEIIYLLLSSCEEMQLNEQSSESLDGTSREALASIHSHLQETISKWTETITKIAHCEMSSEFDEGELALLWGVITCYSRMLITQTKSSMLVDLADALDQLLTIKSDTYKKAWESILGAALSSYNRLYGGCNSGADETGRFLSIAKRYRSCSQVLSAVADYLESKYGSPLEDTGCRIYHPELGVDKLMGAATIFADNLCHNEKEIRISTLKILCHYKPLGWENPPEDQPANKKRRTEVSQSFNVNSTGSNVLQLLLSIETTPISVSTSRSIQLLISKMQMVLSAGRIPEAYVPLILNGVFGILNNRFSHLWDPALECLAVLISKHFTLVWDNFICYMDQLQSISQASCNLHDGVNDLFSHEPTDLVHSFKIFLSAKSDSTPCVTILALLLKSLQKVPMFIESRSRQFMPLFLKFLGYNTDDLKSVGLFDSMHVKAKSGRLS